MQTALSSQTSVSCCRHLQPQNRQCRTARSSQVLCAHQAGMASQAISPVSFSPAVLQSQYRTLERRNSSRCVDLVATLCTGTEQARAAPVKLLAASIAAAALLQSGSADAKVIFQKTQAKKVWTGSVASDFLLWSSWKVLQCRGKPSSAHG